jgi:hypothetical protein
MDLSCWNVARRSGPSSRPIPLALTPPPLALTPPNLDHPGPPDYLRQPSGVSSLGSAGMGGGEVSTPAPFVRGVNQRYLTNYGQVSSDRGL